MKMRLRVFGEATPQSYGSWNSLPVQLGPWRNILTWLISNPIFLSAAKSYSRKLEHCTVRPQLETSYLHITTVLPQVLISGIVIANQ